MDIVLLSLLAGAVMAGQEAPIADSDRTVSDRALDAATDAVIRAAIEQARIPGHWIAKPQVSVSPDRKQVAFIIQRADVDTNGTQTSLWVSSLAAPGSARELADFGGSAGPGKSDFGPTGATLNPAFSPDGREIALVGLGAPDAVAIVDVGTGHVRSLKLVDVGASDRSPRTIQDVEWAPDGGRLAVQFTQEIEGKQERGVAVEPSWSGRSLASSVSRLAIVDARSGRLVAQSPADLDLTGMSGAFSWKPTGSELAFSARHSSDLEYDAKWTDIYSLDAASGQTAPLIKQPGVDLDPRWSPDGKRIAFLTDGGVMRWKAGMRLGLFDAATGKTSVLPPSEATTRSSFAPRWYDQDHVTFVGARQMSCPLFLANTKTMRVRQITPTDLRCMGAAQPAYGGRLVAVSYTFSTPSVLLQFNAGSWAPQVIGPSQKAPLPAAQARAVSWPSADGKFVIHGVLVTPMDGKSGPRPLLVSIPGGPSMVTPETYNADAQYLPYPALLRGYALLVPNTRGRGGYGSAFSDALASNQDFFPAALTDVLGGVDLLVGSRLVDGDRVAAAGFSYGGSLAAYAAGHTNRFKAILSGDHGVDLYATAMDSFGSTHETGLRYISGLSNPYDPAERSKMFSQSAIQSAAKIETPMLIECGMLSLAGTHCLRFFRTVRRTTSTPIELIVYPRTGHGILEPALRYDSARRQISWLDRWVTDVGAGVPPGAAPE